ncbi:fatty acid desaturase [Oscillatoria sp. CS-180]|nr:fatty acid desaturase [Oscillatoria sp. CS-180]MDB9524521.1 fatty acid desaturase [Oscillatoria sp. CS-180]
MAEKIIPCIERCKSLNISLSGLAVAVFIIFSWGATLAVSLKIDVSHTSVVLVGFTVLLRTFLHTGLFVTAHEAIHGVITRNRSIDDVIGSVTAILYAFLLYQKLAKNHRLHHRFPTSEGDPDFCQDNPQNPFLWYVSFMRRYQDGKQFSILFWGMTVVFWGLMLLHVPTENLILFLVLPIFLSSLQLFWFGIYLPHRPLSQGYRDRHCARSIPYPPFWSLLSCYNFGYHWEHHQYPNLAWYQLASVRAENTNSFLREVR